MVQKEEKHQGKKVVKITQETVRKKCSNIKVYIAHKDKKGSKLLFFNSDTNTLI